MKILVTGCAGFIGFHICEDLLKRFNNVSIVGIDNLNNYYPIIIKKKRLDILKGNSKFTFIKANIADLKKINKIFYKYEFDIVIHMAAQAGVRYALINPETYLESNVDGFFNLLRALEKSKVTKFIFASSSSVYGDQKKFPLSENLKPKPINIYSFSKLLNEHVAQDLSNVSNIKFIGLRFFTIYGHFGRPDMLLFKLLNSIFSKKKFYLNNLGNHYRDFTHIDDVKNIIYKLIKKKIDKKFQLFNVCSNKPIKITKLISEVCKITSIRPNIIKAQKHKADVFKTHGDNTKIMKYLNLKKFRNIFSELLSIVTWYKKNKFY